MVKVDQQDRYAAEAIKFRPAKRDGNPVDFPATLRVVFQLAGTTKVPKGTS